MADPALRRLLLRLTPSVYLPTAIYALGASAIVPVLPLAGLRLGLTVADVALVALAAGAISIVGPVPIGRLVIQVGERNAMLLGGVFATAAAVAGMIFARQGSVRPALSAAVFCVTVLAMSLGDVVWDLGRQSFLAEEVPLRYRARAMTLFGGLMRAGRVVGPFLGAAAILVGDLQAAFAIRVLASVICLALVAVWVKPQHQVGEGGSEHEVPGVSNRRRLSVVLLASVAPMVLTAARVNRDLTLPLLGHAANHPPATIALVLGVAAVVELLVMFPAGVLMDRYGRAAVIVPCMLTVGVSYLLAGWTTSMIGFVAMSLVFAVGNGLGSGIVKTLSVDVTPPERRASWLGVYNTAVGTGNLMGPGLVMIGTRIGDVVVACGLTGVVTLAGSAWAGYWVPRLVPRDLSRGD
jgi:MFS family permease